MRKEEIFNQIKDGLIVSCQALEDEPLHSSFIMGRMALAAMQGGAVGIRANTKEDIIEIKNTVELPVIGIVKRDYEDSDIYITPTMKEIDELMESGVEIIALDATNRLRPNNTTLEQFFNDIKAKYPEVLLMADISNYEEGMNASNLGFDFIGTTLSGYTEYTKGVELPNVELMKRLVENSNSKIIAEGGVSTPQDLKKCYESGVYTAVVGGAITRPRDITKRFVAVLENN